MWGTYVDEDTIRGLVGDRPCCTCDKKELRRRIRVNGVEVYAHQCLRCGKECGTVAKAISDTPKNAFDENLSNEWQELISNYWESRKEVQGTLAQEIEEKRKSEWDEWYSNYLMSPAWRQKRRKVLQRADSVCEGCGESRATQVHHMTYKHVGDELLWELRAVCDACHIRVHENKNVAESSRL